MLHRARAAGVLWVSGGLFLLTGCVSTWSDQMRLSERTHWFCCDPPAKECLAYVALGNSPEFRKYPGVSTRPTLVFVHGLGGSKYFWKDIAQLMVSQHEYPTVLIDLLGHGDADKPAGAAYQPSAQGRRLAQFVEAATNRPILGDRFVFIGMSYGAVSSLEAALQLQRPGHALGAPSLEGVVAVSAPAFYFPALEEAPCAIEYLKHPPLAARLALPWFSPGFFERSILTDAMWNEGRIQPADRAEIVSQYSSIAARRALMAATRDMVVELEKRQDGFDRFATIACPTLILGGHQDKIVPNWVQKRLAASLNTHPVLLSDCGHAVAQDQPARLVEALLNFLRRIP